ncbi:HAD domain-containing protein [Leucobacter sp. HY1910]
MSSMDKPIIYLDFDGVLNAIRTGTSQLPRVTGFSGYQRSQISGFIITWSPEVLRRIESLQRTAEIWWLSTWRDQTALIEQQLPVKLDGWLDFEDEGLSYSGKLEALLADQAEHPRPFIWVDDEEHDHYRAAQVRGELPELTGHLLIEPRTRAGLTVDHFERMEAFLAHHNRAVP